MEQIKIGPELNNVDPILACQVLGTEWNEIWSTMQNFPVEEIQLKMSSAKCVPFCSGVNVLIGTKAAYIKWITYIQYTHLIVLFTLDAITVFTRGAWLMCNLQMCSCERYI